MTVRVGAFDFSYLTTNIFRLLIFHPKVVLLCGHFHVFFLSHRHRGRVVYEGANLP